MQSLVRLAFGLVGIFWPSADVSTLRPATPPHRQTTHHPPPTTPTSLLVVKYPSEVQSRSKHFYNNITTRMAVLMGDTGRALSNKEIVKDVSAINNRHRWQRRPTRGPARTRPKLRDDGISSYEHLLMHRRARQVENAMEMEQSRRRGR